MKNSALTRTTHKVEISMRLTGADCIVVVISDEAEVISVERRMQVILCQERVVRREVVEEMRVGPSESPCGRGLQTAMSCCVQKAWW
jgi:hypothetical protein